MTNRIVLVTGGFDPPHSGHIAYFKAAQALGDMLVVGLNSDEWLERKKGRAFMPCHERLCIVSNLQMVDKVYTFNDEDNSAREFIKQVRAHYPESHLIFANGGDRTANNIPEMDVEDSNLTFEFAVGGEDKKNSSSWILKQALLTHHETRVWGSFYDLYQAAGYKVKELIVEPNKGISYQRHFHRGEVWFVQSGCGYVRIGQDTDPLINYTTHKLETHSVFRINPTQWHQLYNTGTEPLVIVEIQYGSQTIEDDIERIEYYKD